MDPTTNLEMQLRIANFVMRSDFLPGTDARDKLERLSELVLSLNEWITKGGCLPKTWDR
jgi:hypothetical protein